MKERIVKTFYELVKIGSVSGNEGDFHKFLIEKFTDMGLTLLEDESMIETKLGGNNLLFTLEGNTKGKSILFSAHTDTVSPGEGIEPYIDVDLIKSKGETILAADDKAGIAIMIELITQLKESNSLYPTLEFILTPGEEIGLIGASAFDMSKLKSKYGFVLDNGGPVGTIILASPTLAMIDITITGKAAHAGLEPENGVSAIEIAANAISKMNLGRISKYTTANIGVINGGTSSNIVAEEVFIKAEARSIDKSEFDNQLLHMKEVLVNTCKEAGGACTFEYKIMSDGYYFNDDTPIVKLASQAIEKLGIRPKYEVSGGGSDANVFNSSGKEVVNVSIGYGDIHTTEEYVSIKEMLLAVNFCKKVIENEILSVSHE